MPQGVRRQSWETQSWSMPQGVRRQSQLLLSSCLGQQTRGRQGRRSQTADSGSSHLEGPEGRRDQLDAAAEDDAA
eukprot:4281480-Pyramimonas_sp.AAC.1